ncbi:anti-anti-sigma factor [Williamsia limnetica]|uniref:Anti-anti-sigma factor n=1 Tax=Williamsia limnetica TaxID=882452 RepID=A0A318RTY6_WILLI|nr:STAS domain-containing protein [Williamsia limnetica]PYE12733.1 anti-anti-sigma factor [Williamsia limnetica]
MPVERNNKAFIADDSADTVGSAALTVVTVAHSELVILTVQGAVDALTAPQLSESINDALTGAPRGVIIDLSTTEFLASAGMTALVTAYEAIAPTGLFGVVADGPATSRPLHLVGLDQTFTLYPTLDQAIADMA